MNLLVCFSQFAFGEFCIAARLCHFGIDGIRSFGKILARIISMLLHIGNGPGHLLQVGNLDFLRIRKSYKKPNPLAKHIVCTCGHALCWHKDKRTGEELFYCRYCRAHKENGKNLKVPAATIYKKVMDALELEHLEEEKLAAAIQQGAGRKAIEVVRAEKSLQMKSILAELNMEQFRRVPLYESYMANEITEEQYRAELLDYEEAHRKLNEQLTAIMEDTLVWERALSLRNPWIQQMAQYKTPEELDRNFVKKYIEQVTVTLRDDGQAEISLAMKTDEWKQMLSRIEVEGTDSGTKE